MIWIISYRDKFNRWLLSDDFPLRLAMMMIVSVTFDMLLTFQALFNSKEFFLRTEKNVILIYAYQNNLGWLYASCQSILYILVILFSKKKGISEKEFAFGRYILFLIPSLQFLFAILWLFI